jgi:polar amino acid transport system ATP-binding protein
MSAVMVKAESVHKSFGHVEVLKGIDLEVKNGEVFCLLGPGMVFQRFNLFPHLTALENVTEGPITVQKRRAREAPSEALALLERVGLADKRDRLPDRALGRPAAARRDRPRACHAAEGMLFDEPTSALDPELVGEVLEVMRDLADGA